MEEKAFKQGDQEVRELNSLIECVMPTKVFLL